MIYNDEFVWLHFPKCAGTKVEKLFAAYFSEVEGLHQDVVGLANDPTLAWHDSIHDRERRDSRFSLGDRVIVCSFRRLRPWLISRYNFEQGRSPELPHDPELLLQGSFLEASGAIGHADSYARKYLPRHYLKTRQVRFLRTEYFEQDFKSVFGDYLDVSVVPDVEYAKQVNRSPSFLPETAQELLSSKQDRLGAHCPYWRDLENLAYG